MSSGSNQSGRLRLGVWIAGLAGVGLAAWMLKSYGAVRIAEVLLRAGYLGTLAVAVLHLPQMLLSSLGWRAIAGREGAQPGLRGYTLLRWIREAVNNLLPLAQIGGEFVTARLLQRRGIPLASAISGTVADLLMEMATQVLFTVGGVLLLVHTTGASDVSISLSRALLIAALVLGGVFAALGLGLTVAIEAAIVRLGRSLGWPATARIAGLHEALHACFREPARVTLAAMWHGLSWLLGALEVWLILHLFGQSVSAGPALIIESLGQAAKALGFAIPAALGVQEGGYLIVCSLLGLPPELGLALSLMKRLREVIWGVPGLVIWQRERSRAAAAPAIRGSAP